MRQSPALAAAVISPKYAGGRFRLTFPAPKSVSRLREVADAGTQALIVQAHYDVGGGYADSGLVAR